MARNEDPDRAIAILRTVADGMRTDPQWAPRILAAPEVFGIEGLSDSVPSEIHSRP